MRGGDDDALAARRDKHLAALLTVATTVLFFLGVRSCHGEASALAAALVMALGTTVLSNTSQALWSITGGLFLLSVALWLLLAPDASVVRALLAGLAVGGAFACRPTALLAGGAMAMLVWRRWRELLVYAFGVLRSVGVTVLALQAVYGHPLGAMASSTTGSAGATTSRRA